MSFPAYPEYKNNEIPWMQRIPSSWQLLPFFSRFFERKESNKGMKSENLLSLSYGRIVRKDITTLEGLLPASFETYQVVHPGDIVFRLTDLQNDKRSLRSAIVNEKGIITSAYLAVSAKDFNPTFSNYLFRAYDLMKVFYSMGGGLRQSMKYDDMKWLPIVCPSINEQTQIARFLDHETSKIDALIREQERLIALLQEKRRAVISHAVTKGLDPGVSMKDSGVEWIGEVPAHWDICPIKFLVSTPVTDGPHETPEFIDEGIPFISAEAVSQGEINFNKAKFISAHDHSRYSRKYKPKLHDIFMVKSGATTGTIAINEADTEFNIWSPLAVIRCSDIADPHYILHAMRSQNFQESIVLSWSFGTQQNIGMGVIENLPIALPPLGEQLQIKNYLNEIGVVWGSLEFEARRAINLLKERRSALISAAVTGKIDVRNWRPPADESAFNEQIRRAGMETTA
ncbi:restriction endonuclease subunit S [Marinobacter hydrocarbonoclasticus]|uniref:restriction endonuclease subunit S n=1 Tax=Marinobacter nauticus TaxID=2743 RepID=UPI001C981A7A|nr:restriction endonuclease subunit S [Marinobacter nauticus]MBY6195555.1 restriction endonuclease subunit S [Marinobacter nauticus]MBY6216698.1 restriction endonuclease subunit S [Marinobacter nauticus]